MPRKASGRRSETERLHRRRGRNGASSLKRRGTQLYPLRAITGYTESPAGAPLEVLECGHTQHIRQDMIGETVAARRRCRQCPQRID